MTKRKFLVDCVVVCALLALCALSVLPPQVVMPTPLQMGVLIIALSMTSAFLVFFWRESPRDEREKNNMDQASRVAYLLGALTLIIALLIQGVTHTIDPVIPIALSVMVTSKILIQRIKNND